MAGISVKAVNLLEQNKYKYNGIEFTDDLGIEVYDAFYRELDPQIGRWNQVDPKVDDMEAWSPYASNYDNPIRFSDFLGDEPDGDDPDEGRLTFRKVAASVLGTLNGIVKSTGIFKGAQGETMPWTDAELAYFKAGELVGGVGGPLLPLAGSRMGPTESLTPVPAGGGRAMPATQSAPLGTLLPESQGTKQAKGTREHGNSLNDKAAEGYTLRDKKTKEVKKYGETTRGEDRFGTGKQKRYSKKQLDAMGVEYNKETSGTKKEMHGWQHELIKQHKNNNNGKRPDLNKNDY